MNEFIAGYSQHLTRRHLLGRGATAAGIAAMASLFGRSAQASPVPQTTAALSRSFPEFAPKAKHIIYLFQSGGPSQLETFDYKPMLPKLQGTELPESIRMGQRLTGMTSAQTSFPVIASKFKFKQYGKSGAWISELLPHLAGVVDDLCIVKSVYTEAINHDPAITFIQTGSQQPGRPSFGAWVAYGLGTQARDLPAFVVLLSQGSGKDSNQGLLERLWGSGFLPSNYQGVKLRSGSDPVLYLSDPPGIDRQTRRHMLDAMDKLNAQHFRQSADPEITARIGQGEMAFKMQASIPQLTDLTGEPSGTFDLYGPDSRKPGTFAANCLLARRMVERGVRFVQLYHRGWDHHAALPENLPKQCSDIDQPCAGLIQDLKRRGLLDDTLVVWAGEFGRTVYGQGKLQDNYGRDHHGRCFTVWMAGGGIKPGIVHGETDDFGYNITAKPVHIHDLNATLLHCLGIEHTHLVYRNQGRDFRLTDVYGNVMNDLLA
jgi:hypothetical protein